MEIGRSSPRHQELALLYPRSKSLQAHINEYFIIVVRLCHDVSRFGQKSCLRQFTTTLSSDMIKTAQSDLDHWANEIKNELTLLVAKRVEEEAVQSSRFRLVAEKLSKSISQQQKLATRLKILDKCSKYDYETAWKQIRKSGNTSLFAQTDDYNTWLSLIHI